MRSTKQKLTEPIHVLISLHRGYGLGDAVQVSAVLRHVARYRPHWIVDYQAEEGRHQPGRGIVAATFAYGQPYPSPHYDAEVQVLLFDTWANWHDRPNTRVSSCLRERFGLPWDAECGRYRVDVSEEARHMTALFVEPTDGRFVRGVVPVYKRHHVANLDEIRGHRVVAVHYRGDSSPAKKDLTHEQAWLICKEIEKLACTPLVIDWRGQSPLAGEYRTTGRLPTSIQWGANAEMNCALISQCAAFVGIDSGPSKCASATDTPALVVWTGHHPAPFHDPAPNTTHLVPRGYHGLEPVCGDRGVIDWFESHYNVRQYEHDPVGEVGAWLKEVLK